MGWLWGTPFRIVWKPFMNVYHQRSLEVVVKILTPFNSLLAGAKDVIPGGWERLRGPWGTGRQKRN